MVLLDGLLRDEISAMSHITRSSNNQRGIFSSSLLCKTWIPIIWDFYTLYGLLRAESFNNTPSSRTFTGQYVERQQTVRELAGIRPPGTLSEYIVHMPIRALILLSQSCATAADRKDCFLSSANVSPVSKLPTMMTSNPHLLR
jgi:hypothetical protein